MHGINGLTHNELTSLKRTLEKRERALREAMHAEFAQRNANGGSAESTVQYHESTDDEAIVDVLNDSAVKTMADYAAALNEIERSLAEIKSGKYGVCSDCARHIGYKRLSANPTATRCVPCQSKRERNSDVAAHHPSL
jgi:DnaK suppressor protein